MGKRLCETSKGETVNLYEDKTTYRVVSNRPYYSRNNRTYYGVLQNTENGRLRGLAYNRKRRVW